VCDVQHIAFKSLNVYAYHHENKGKEKDTCGQNDLLGDRDCLLLLCLLNSNILFPCIPYKSPEFIS